MTAKTPRYELEYATPNDLVEQLPNHMQANALSIEQALADVDDRHTTNAYATVVRSTYAQLKSVKAQAGQLGFVTGDTALYHGAYMFDGSSWIMQGTRDITSILTNRINNNYWTIPRLSVILTANNLITVNTTVHRGDGDWRSNGSTNNGAQDLWSLPSNIKPKEIAWHPFDPRFGVSAAFKNDNSGIFVIVWSQAAASNRPLPANNNVDFTLTQAVQVTM